MWCHRIRRFKVTWAKWSKHRIAFAWEKKLVSDKLVKCIFQVQIVTYSVCYFPEFYFNRRLKTEGYTHCFKECFRVLPTAPNCSWTKKKIWKWSRGALIRLFLYYKMEALCFCLLSPEKLLLLTLNTPGLMNFHYPGGCCCSFVAEVNCYWLEAH